MQTKPWGSRVVPYPQASIERYVRTGSWSELPTAERFHQVALEFPRHVAVVDQQGATTYGELDRRTDQIAAALIDLGIKPYDSAIFQVTNRMAAVLAWYGFLKAGAIPVATLASHREHEIGYISRKVGATAHLVDSDLPKFDLVEFAKKQSAGHPSMGLVLTIGSRAVRGVERIEELGSGYDPVAARMKVAVVQALLLPSDVAVFQLSGGTTGVPKVIPRLHAEYWNNALWYAQRLGRTERTRVAYLAPLVHNAGVLCGLHGAHAVGARLVLPPLEPGPAMKFMAAEQVDDVLFGPSSFQWPEHPEYAEMARCLSSVVLSGTKVPGAVFDRVQQMGGRVGQLFGMAEGLCAATAPDTPESIRRDHVGFPLAEEDEMRIVDPASGEEVPDGQIGELTCRGPYTIPGYFDAADRNQQAFTDDGFYRTGDLAKVDMIDGRRYLSIEGRIKDVINRGGEKINAEEVELLLLRHPAISSAAVVAMPDLRLGERSCAYIVTGDAALTLVDVQEHFNSIGVAKFKWPERVECVDALPQTYVGKIDKKALRERISAAMTTDVEAEGRR
ncbi:2,3-dihydroxybenzoate-AMP ligase [Mycobacteroides franklinii]|uniref:2,3-dihydroxybenzoate-AMP ligase n=1 Tax=Mycobacteroides franklinii TaxID=948102 RepID=A0A1S1LDN0_9MYCO|nr:2,3-dihydroxybenzoate-AMP ligase [Mycobacteroides franklinii]